MPYEFDLAAQYRKSGSVVKSLSGSVKKREKSLCGHRCIDRQTDRQSMTGRSDMHIHSPNTAPVVPGILMTSLREQDSTERI